MEEKEEEGGNGCWMPDPVQFVQKRIKVEGVGIKMVQDLTMDDFLRLVTNLLFLFCNLGSSNCQNIKFVTRFCSSVGIFCRNLNF